MASPALGLAFVTLGEPFLLLVLLLRMFMRLLVLALLAVGLDEADLVLTIPSDREEPEEVDSVVSSCT